MNCYDPGGSRPRPVIFACLFSLSLQQVIGDRCIIDWMGYKSPGQPADGRALDSRHLVIVGQRLDLVIVGQRLDFDRWIFGLSPSFVLNYHLTDFTLHLLFLFTTLTFTTRFAYN